MRLGLSAGLVLSVAGAARGQLPPRATMHYQVILADAGGNGNGIVEPGELVELVVTARFWPDIGQPTQWNHYQFPWPATVYAYAGSIIDLNGLENSATGSLEFNVPAPWNLGLNGTLVPATQSVIDSNSGQFVHLPSQPGVQVNPVEVLRGTWTPVSFQERTLRYGVSVDAGAIYVLTGLAQPGGEATINTGSEASILIVPGPGVMGVLGAGAAWSAGRRRRR